MKHVWFLLAFLVVSATSLFAEDFPVAFPDSASKSLSSTVSFETSGQIVLYRGTNYISANNRYGIQVDDSLVTTLLNCSMYTLSCTPGMHRITVVGYPSLYIEVPVKAYGVCYVRLGFKPETRVVMPELLVVDDQKAEAEMQNERMRNLNITETRASHGKHTNAFSFHAGVGLGFKQFDVCELEDGTTAHFSFGSRYNVGLAYAMGFGKHFELEGAVLYHGCEVTPAVEDLSIYFGGLQLAPTASLVLPFSGVFDMKLKIGAGIDGYFFNFYHENTQVLSGGIKARWNYENALGYHARILLEMGMDRHTFIGYGLEYTDVTFQYKSGDPSWIDYVRPNGNGIQFICRWTYVF